MSTTQMEQLSYLAENLSGDTSASRAMITKLEITKEFIGFGGCWKSAPLEPLAGGERRIFFQSPQAVIEYYGCDYAQGLLDEGYKFVTQLCDDGRWAVSILRKTDADLAREAVIDSETV